MITNWFIKKGFVYKDSKSSDNGFDLQRWLKRILKRFNVTIFDPCCDTESNYVPMRFNLDTNKIEVIYPGSGEWTYLDFVYDSETGTITIQPD